MNDPEETNNPPDRYQEWADSELVLDHEADPDPFRNIGPWDSSWPDAGHSS
jgi:hypothetical protein